MMKIEAALDKLDETIAEIDASMLEHGRDLDLLKELQGKRDAAESKSAALWEEMEGLDSLLSA